MDSCSCVDIWYKGYANFQKWRGKKMIKRIIAYIKGLVSSHKCIDMKDVHSMSQCIDCGKIHYEVNK